MTAFSIVSSEVRGLSHPVDQLVKELDTDWFPDPWCWAFPSLAKEAPLKSFDVPFPGGSVRTVPVVEFAHRIRFARAAAEVVWSTQGSLSEGVFGFGVDRDRTFRHYRDELRRRATFEQSTARHLPFVASTDIRSFFRSVTINHVNNAVQDMDSGKALIELIAMMSLFTEEFGYPLPEGHGASRGVASLVLLPVDETIDRPFARWLDDYRIFARSRSEAASGLGRLIDALESNAFTVAPEKTVTHRYRVVSEGYAASLADHSPAKAPMLDDALRESSPSLRDWEKRVRLAMRTASDHPDASDIDIISSHSERIPDIAYPRLAWLLFQHINEQTTWNVLLDLLHREAGLRKWRLLRLLPLLWYVPSDVARKATGVVEEAIMEDGPLRLVAARVAAKQMPSLVTSIYSELGEREQFLVSCEVDGSPKSEYAAGIDEDAQSLGLALAGPPVHSYL